MKQLTNNELDHTMRMVYRNLSLPDALRDRLVSALFELKMTRMDLDGRARKMSEPVKEGDAPIDPDAMCVTCQQPRWAHEEDAPHYVMRDHEFVASPPKQQGNSTPATPKRPSDLCGTCGNRRDDHHVRHPFNEIGAVYGRPYEPPSTAIVEEFSARDRRCIACGEPSHKHTAGQLNTMPHVFIDPKPHDIPLGDFTWIVNNLGELGVKVRDTFVFFHDGRAIRYTTEATTRLQWRPVKLGEYGIIRPCNTDWKGDYYIHGEGWQDLPLAEF